VTGIRRSFAIGFAAVLVLGASLASARPHVVERYGLYLGSQQQATAHLFLDPFPNAYSCEVRVKVFAANAEPAFCRSHYELEVGSGNDAILAADFDPFSAAAWYCIPRWIGRLNVALSSGSRTRSAQPQAQPPIRR